MRTGQRTKRVLMVAPTPFFADRGCHVHIAEQAWALQRQGIKVLITTYAQGRDLPGLSITRTVYFPWYKKTAIGPSWHKFYVDIFLLFTTLRAAQKFRPDIIHGHLHEGCLIGWIVGRLLHIPLIFDCQGSLTGELLAHNFPLVRLSPLRRLWYALEYWIDSLPALILAQSTEMRRELVERFHIPTKNIVITFDGVNTRVFQPKLQDRQFRQTLNIPANKKVVVYLGGLTPHKGVDTLLRAFSIVRQTIPDAFLLLMGYPNERQYQKQAEDLGLTGHIHITGRILYEEAPRYLALGDIAVAPKRTQTEANGKIYNYMAAGLPTVAFDTVVNRDILGDLGVYTNLAADHQGLAKTIIGLLQNPSLCHRLAWQVRTKAVNKYSWDKVADRIIRAYKQALVPWQLRVFAVSIRKKEKWHWAKPRIISALKPQSRCLDLGSGVGTLSILQERLGGRWEFIETDPAAAGQTRAIVRGPVLGIDIFDPSLKPGAYDLITAFDVLEHVKKPGAFLNQAAALLKTDGHIIITTPADNGGFYLWRAAASRLFGITKKTHGHVVDGFSRQQLDSFCQSAGLSLARCDLFSRFFTELIELVYNAAYIIKNRSRQNASGYNLSLSPASGADFHRHTRPLVLLRAVHPLLRGLSLLDRLFPFTRGYEWGIIASKDYVPHQKHDQSQEAYAAQRQGAWP